MEFFDTHCHLNHPDYSDDLEVVLENARLAGVGKIIVPGWDANSSQKAVQMAEAYPQIYAAVGIHPTEWEHFSEADNIAIRALSTHPRVVAIGEIGLDYYHTPLDKPAQKNLLRSMLNIADSAQKPVILHSRESMNDILVLINEWILANPHRNFLPGVFHAFEGDLKQANESIDLGFMLGVGGPVTYKNAQLKKEVFSSIPVERILLETDAPYLAPVPQRGKRNEPGFLKYVSPVLAELCTTSEAELLEQILKNSNKLFLEDRTN
ncbi:MAG: TatD family hydrolase [Anaerolineaceae bacterium]|nr:TatD family hydrolase [Anaerolineaceae bacterium]